HVPAAPAAARSPVLRAGRGAAQGAVVLGAAEEAVAVRIYGSMVELGDLIAVVERRPADLVRDRVAADALQGGAHRGARVVGAVETAVAGHEELPIAGAVVLRMEGDRVVVGVGEVGIGRVEPP